MSSLAIAAFPPEKLPTSLQLVSLVGRANASLSRYDGLLESLVNPDVLLSPLVMKEAELSSRIEGTIATANEVFQQQAGEKFEPEKDADIQEILNYRSTLRFGARAIGEGPLSLHLIRQMHANLMVGVRGEDKNPGAFRTTQNWIGPHGCTIEQATYVPPDPILLDELLENFINYVQIDSLSIDPIIQTALVHAQFEMIHPFDDGNGRIGRILIPLLLMKRRSIVSPSLYLSGYLERHRDRYYSLLNNISQQGDWEEWITFFLECVIEQSEKNLELIQKIIGLYEAHKHILADLLHSDQAIHILDILFDTPVFRATDIHTRLGIQRQRAAHYIRKMKSAGVVEELRAASGQKPAILSFNALWKITDLQ